MIKITEETEFLINRISESETEGFSALVQLAQLDPNQDLRYSDLKGVDFVGSQLEGFDFSFSDLRGAIWGDTSFYQSSKFRLAMRGHGQDQIDAHDFPNIARCAISAKTWGERFLAFALLTDNFGLVEETFELLSRIVNLEKSKYMRVCSYTYFLAVSFKSTEAMNYCRTMALNANARSNMFRIKRLNRYRDDLSLYSKRSTRKRSYPGEVLPERIINLTENMGKQPEIFL